MLINQNRKKKIGKINISTLKSVVSKMHVRTTFIFKHMELQY